MKKITREDFAMLKNHYPVLNPSAMARIVAGTGYTSPGLMDMNCVHRTFYHLGFDTYGCQSFYKSYGQIADMYNDQFHTDIVRDGGTSIDNIKPFFQKYFETGGNLAVGAIADFYKDKTFSGNMHANLKRSDGSYHSVVIKSIKDGKIEYYDPTTNETTKINIRDASSHFIGMVFEVKGVKDPNCGSSSSSSSSYGSSSYNSSGYGSSTSSSSYGSSTSSSSSYGSSSYGSSSYGSSSYSSSGSAHSSSYSSSGSSSSSGYYSSTSV